MDKYKLVPVARKLRKAMSLPEILLWQRLKTRVSGAPVFRRQHPFQNYVFDFYCPKLNLIIEVDGYQHQMGDNPKKDQERDEYLISLGFNIFRIEAKDILINPDEIADNIRHYASEKSKEKKP